MEEKCVPYLEYVVNSYRMGGELELLQKIMLFLDRVSVSGGVSVSREVSGMSGGVSVNVWKRQCEWVLGCLACLTLSPLAEGGKPTVCTDLRVDAADIEGQLTIVAIQPYS